MLDEHSFRQELASEMERAKRGNKRLSILVCRLGSPGQYDFVGQRTDDPLLERAGEALLEQKRQIDVAASLGQGRFALILPETGEPGALIMAGRLTAAVASACMNQSEVPEFGFGVASLGRHGRSANALLRAAERAAVAAKQAGQDGLLNERRQSAEEMAALVSGSSKADPRAA